MSSNTSHPAGVHGQLVQKWKIIPIAGGRGTISYCGHNSSPTSHSLYLFGPMIYVSILTYDIADLIQIGNRIHTVYTRVIVYFLSPKYSFILGGSTFTRGTFLAI